MVFFSHFGVYSFFFHSGVDDNRIRSSHFLYVSVVDLFIKIVHEINHMTKFNRIENRFGWMRRGTWHRYFLLLSILLSIVSTWTLLYRWQLSYVFFVRFTKSIFLKLIQAFWEFYFCFSLRFGYALFPLSTLLNTI